MENLSGERKHRHTIVFTIIFVFFIIAVGVGSYFLYVKFDSELFTIRSAQEEQYIRHLETNQFLLSTIDWSSIRQKTILFMRDKIVEEWQRIGLKIDYEKAYKIAEVDVYECEKYPYIEPLLLLAMQWRESSFIDSSVSPMGAIGINQIMPSTGRMMCLIINASYSKNILYDIKMSTKMAMKLLDILYAEYGSIGQMLAAYNGGPWQAYYYSNEKSKLCSETSKYVPEILRKKEQLTEEFKTYKIQNMLIKYK